MISKQTLGTVAAVVGIAVVMGLGVFALSTVPVNGQSAPGTTTTHPVSTQYATPADNPLAPSPSATPTDTATSTPTATVAPVAPAPVAAPAPAPAAPAPQAVVAPAPAPAPAPVAPAPIKCPAGSSANSNDGVNDTSCYPDICMSIAVPDPAHPECNAPFKP